MADTSTRVSGPIDVRSDGSHRIAYELMDRIARYEDSPDKKKREYWLKLYSQCNRAVVDGVNRLEDIVGND